MLVQVGNGLSKAFEIADLGFLFSVGEAVGSSIANDAVVSEQLRKHGLLRPFEFLADSGDPCCKLADFAPCCAEEFIGFANPAIELTFVGCDASGFHLPDEWAFVHSGNLLDALPRVGTVIDAFRQILFRKFVVAHSAPFGAPMLESFRPAPIGCGYCVEYEFAACVAHAVSIFIQMVNAVLFAAPASVHFDGTHGRHHMEVRIGDATILLRRMHSEVRNHTACDELLLHKCTGERDVFLNREFALQRNIKTVSELCIAAAFGFFNRIPKCFAIEILSRSMIRKEDLRVNHAALSRVVVRFTIAGTDQLFTGTIRSAGYGALPGAAANLFDAEMIQSHDHGSHSEGAYMLSALFTMVHTSGREKTNSIVS